MGWRDVDSWNEFYIFAKVVILYCRSYITISIASIRYVPEVTRTSLICDFSKFCYDGRLLRLPWNQDRACVAASLGGGSDGGSRLLGCKVMTMMMVGVSGNATLLHLFLCDIMVIIQLHQQGGIHLFVDVGEAPVVSLKQSGRN